ncbi:MAG: tetratricopeptide repeat protein [Phycisphaerae bacterium]|nr:tetratricopeptide repeat protein [Phycisphaerae bacterium]
MFQNFISLFIFVSIFSLSSLSFAETATPSQNAEILYATANQLEEARKFDEAKALYQQVLQQYPNSEFAAGADGKWMTADDGLSLQSTSPCRNTGDNSAVSSIATDITDNIRIINSVVDRGAYEYPN